MSKKLKIYQVDAFTGQYFKGNPAAVCILEEDISDELMKSIIKEIKYEPNLKPSFDKLKELECSSNVKGIGVTCKGTKKYDFIEKIIWYFCKPRR